VEGFAKIELKNYHAIQTHKTRHCLLKDGNHLMNKQVQNLVRQLIVLWFSDWENADYPSILLSVMKDPDSANSRERPIINKLREILSNDEWDQLPRIAREEYRRFKQLTEVKPKLEEQIRKFQLQRAHDLALEYEDCFDHDDRDWYKKRRYEQIEKRKASIQDLLLSGETAEAKELYGVSLEVLLDEEGRQFTEWFTEALRKIVDNYITSYVIPLLEKYQFDQAREAFSRIQEYASIGEYERLEDTYRKQQIAEREAMAIRALLEQGDFSGAQQRFRESATLTGEHFTRLMAPHVKECFVKEFRFELDDYKALALSSVAQNTLVEARAGSGKTTLLACLVQLLVRKIDVSPDQILVMAFNKSAAKKILKEIREVHGVPEFTNARTFHSLAWHLVEPQRKLRVLTDEKDKEAWEKSRIQFLERVWGKTRRRRPWLWLLSFLMFRREIKKEMKPDSEEYFLYRRNQCEISLRGEVVKSKGEKYIADFLLEHDIHYSYERMYFWDGQLYRPDFTVFLGDRQKVIIEHWAINPDDPTSVVPAGWPKTTEQYRAEIRRKREYWKKEGIPLLETNADQVRRMSREQFESYLKNMLEKIGIVCRKLPREEIMERVSDSQTRKLVKLLSQFISRAKKAGLSPEDVRTLYREAEDPRTRAFGSIAWRVYQEYEVEMEREGITDYDTLLIDAAKRVKQNNGHIRVEDHTRGEFDLNRLQWILIDEFQDFSRLFDNLLAEIRVYNPDLKMYCVGDNWQAINEFAGSDLRYFERFEKLYPESSRQYLPINRRSREDIVKAGNRFMHWAEGRPAEAREDKPGGRIQIMYVDDVFIELRDEQLSNGDNEIDQYLTVRYDRDRNSVDVLASKYLKLVYRIIAQNPERSYSILARTNWISSLELQSFESKLHYCLSKQYPEKRRSDWHVTVSTVHSYKGGESDVAIVLRVINRQFPLIHPDSALFQPIGQSVADTIDEERRLFYVAISRPRDELILVTEKGYESCFIDDLLGDKWRNRYLESKERG